MILLQIILINSVANYDYESRIVTENIFDAPDCVGTPKFSFATRHGNCTKANEGFLRTWKIINPNWGADELFVGFSIQNDGTIHKCYAKNSLSRCESLLHENINWTSYYYGDTWADHESCELLTVDVCLGEDVTFGWNYIDHHYYEDYREKMYYCNCEHALYHISAEMPSPPPPEMPSSPPKVPPATPSSPFSSSAPLNTEVMNIIIIIIWIILALFMTALLVKITK